MEYFYLYKTYLIRSNANEVSCVYSILWITFEQRGWVEIEYFTARYHSQLNLAFDPVVPAAGYVIL